MSPYYLDYAPRDNPPYIVRFKFAGDVVMGEFVCEQDAEDFAAYRNAMLIKYDNSGVTDYTDIEGGLR